MSRSARGRRIDRSAARPGIPAWRRHGRQCPSPCAKGHSTGQSPRHGSRLRKPGGSGQERRPLTGLTGQSASARSPAPLILLLIVTRMGRDYRPGSRQRIKQVSRRAATTRLLESCESLTQHGRPECAQCWSFNRDIEMSTKGRSHAYVSIYPPFILLSRIPRSGRPLLHLI